MDFTRQDENRIKTESSTEVSTEWSNVLTHYSELQKLLNTCNTEARHSWAIIDKVRRSASNVTLELSDLEKELSNGITLLTKNTDVTQQKTDFQYVKTSRQESFMSLNAPDTKTTEIKKSKIPRLISPLLKYQKNCPRNKEMNNLHDLSESSFKGSDDCNRCKNCHKLYFNDNFLKKLRHQYLEKREAPPKNDNLFTKMTNNWRPLGSISSTPGTSSKTSVRLSKKQTSKLSHETQISNVYYNFVKKSKSANDCSNSSVTEKSHLEQIKYILNNYNKKKLRIKSLSETHINPARCYFPKFYNNGLLCHMPNYTATYDYARGTCKERCCTRCNRFIKQQCCEETKAPKCYEDSDSTEDSISVCEDSKKDQDCQTEYEADCTKLYCSNSGIRMDLNDLSPQKQCIPCDSISIKAFTLPAERENKCTRYESSDVKEPISITCEDFKHKKKLDEFSGNLEQKKCHFDDDNVTHQIKNKKESKTECNEIKFQNVKTVSSNIYTVDLDDIITSTRMYTIPFDRIRNNSVSTNESILSRCSVLSSDKIEVNAEKEKIEAMCSQILASRDRRDKESNCLNDERKLSNNEAEKLRRCSERKNEISHKFLTKKNLSITEVKNKERLITEPKLVEEKKERGSIFKLDLPTLYEDQDSSEDGKQPSKTTQEQASEQKSTLERTDNEILKRESSEDMYDIIEELNKLSKKGTRMYNKKSNNVKPKISSEDESPESEILERKIINRFRHSSTESNQINMEKQPIKRVRESTSTPFESSNESEEPKKIKKLESKYIQATRDAEPSQKEIGVQCDLILKHNSPKQRKSNAIDKNNPNKSTTTKKIKTKTKTKSNRPVYISNIPRVIMKETLNYVALTPRISQTKTSFRRYPRSAPCPPFRNRCLPKIQNPCIRARSGEQMVLTDSRTVCVGGREMEEFELTCKVPVSKTNVPSVSFSQSPSDVCSEGKTRNSPFFCKLEKFSENGCDQLSTSCSDLKVTAIRLSRGSSNPCSEDKTRNSTCKFERIPENYCRPSPELSKSSSDRKMTAIRLSRSFSNPCSENKTRNETCKVEKMLECYCRPSPELSKCSSDRKMTAIRLSRSFSNPCSENKTRNETCKVEKIPESYCRPSREMSKSSSDRKITAIRLSRSSSNTYSEAKYCSHRANDPCNRSERESRELRVTYKEPQLPPCDPCICPVNNKGLYKENHVSIEAVNCDIISVKPREKTVCVEKCHAFDSKMDTCDCLNSCQEKKSPSEYKSNAILCVSDKIIKPGMYAVNSMGCQTELTGNIPKYRISAHEKGEKTSGNTVEYNYTCACCQDTPKIQDICDSYHNSTIYSMDGDSCECIKDKNKCDCDETKEINHNLRDESDFDDLQTIKSVSKTENKTQKSHCYQNVQTEIFSELNLLNNASQTEDLLTNNAREIIELLTSSLISENRLKFWTKNQATSASSKELSLDQINDGTQTEKYNISKAISTIPKTRQKNNKTRDLEQQTSEQDVSAVSSAMTLYGLSILSNIQESNDPKTEIKNHTETKPNTDIKNEQFEPKIAQIKEEEEEKSKKIISFDFEENKCEKDPKFATWTLPDQRLSKEEILTKFEFKTQVEPSNSINLEELSKNFAKWTLPDQRALLTTKSLHRFSTIIKNLKSKSCPSSVQIIDDTFDQNEVKDLCLQHGSSKELSRSSFRSKSPVRFNEYQSMPVLVERNKPSKICKNCDSEIFLYYFNNQQDFKQNKSKIKDVKSVNNGIKINNFLSGINNKKHNCPAEKALMLNLKKKRGNKPEIFVSVEVQRFTPNENHDKLKLKQVEEYTHESSKDSLNSPTNVHKAECKVNPPAYLTKRNRWIKYNNLKLKNITFSKDKKSPMINTKINDKRKKHSTKRTSKISYKIESDQSIECKVKIQSIEKSLKFKKDLKKFPRSKLPREITDSPRIEIEDGVIITRAASPHLNNSQKEEKFDKLSHLNRNKKRLDQIRAKSFKSHKVTKSEQKISQRESMKSIMDIVLNILSPPLPEKEDQEVKSITDKNDVNVKYVPEKINPKNKSEYGKRDIRKKAKGLNTITRITQRTSKIQTSTDKKSTTTKNNSKQNKTNTINKHRNKTIEKDCTRKFVKLENPGIELKNSSCGCQIENETIMKTSDFPMNRKTPWTKFGNQFSSIPEIDDEDVEKDRKLIRNVESKAKSLNLKKSDISIIETSKFYEMEPIKKFMNAMQKRKRVSEILDAYTGLSQNEIRTKLKPQISNTKLNFTEIPFAVKQVPIDELKPRINIISELKSKETQCAVKDKENKLQNQTKREPIDKLKPQITKSTKIQLAVKGKKEKLQKQGQKMPIDEKIGKKSFVNRGISVCLSNDNLKAIKNKENRSFTQFIINKIVQPTNRSQSLPPSFKEKNYQELSQIHLKEVRKELNDIKNFKIFDQEPEINKSDIDQFQQDQNRLNIHKSQLKKLNEILDERTPCFRSLKTCQKIKYNSDENENICTCESNDIFKPSGQISLGRACFYKPRLNYGKNIITNKFQKSSQNSSTCTKISQVDEKLSYEQEIWKRDENDHLYDKSENIFDKIAKLNDTSQNTENITVTNESISNLTYTLNSIKNKNSTNNNRHIEYEIKYKDENKMDVRVLETLGKWQMTPSMEEFMNQTQNHFISKNKETLDSHKINKVELPCKSKKDFVVMQFKTQNIHRFGSTSYKHLLSSIAKSEEPYITGSKIKRKRKQNLINKPNVEGIYPQNCDRFDSYFNTLSEISSLPPNKKQLTKLEDYIQALKKLTKKLKRHLITVKIALDRNNLLPKTEQIEEIHQKDKSNQNQTGNPKEGYNTLIHIHQELNNIKVKINQTKFIDFNSDTFNMIRNKTEKERLIKINQFELAQMQSIEKQIEMLNNDILNQINVKYLPNEEALVRMKQEKLAETKTRLNAKLIEIHKLILYQVQNQTNKNKGNTNSDKRLRKKLEHVGEVLKNELANINILIKENREE